MLRAEVEILGTAEEGIPVLGAVPWLEAVKLDLISLDEAFLFLPFPQSELRLRLLLQVLL